jgi:hypothetical protein
MKAYQCVLAGMLGLGVWTMPAIGAAQSVLEQLRFDPPRVCPRDTFRWGVSYRGIPGGLAAVKAVTMEAQWEGPDQQTFRSLLTPTRDDFRSNTTDQGRFESRLMHAGPARTGPPGVAEIRYTLRVVLADGQELTAAAPMHYLDSCPPPPMHATLAAGPTGRIGVQTTTPTSQEFLQGTRLAATSLIWGDLELPRDEQSSGARPSSWSMAPGESARVKIDGRRSSARPASPRSSSIASRAGASPSPPMTRRSSAASPWLGTRIGRSSYWSRTHESIRRGSR